MDVGVIGLGIIGGRVAENLRAAGYRVWVWSRTVRPVPNFVGSPSEVARNAERVFIYVSDGPALLDTLREMRPQTGPRHVIVNHATVSPEETLEAAGIVEATGARFLDAPFTGSRDAAAARQLVYFVGGEAGVLESVRQVLAVNSKQILHLGKVGDASLVKIATNLVAAATVTALAEALALVRAHGVPPESFTGALNAGIARSGLSDLKLPSMIGKDFEPRFALRNMVKDMRLAQRMEEGRGVAPLLTQAFLEAAAKAAEQGCEEKDFSVIAEHFGGEKPKRR